MVYGNDSQSKKSAGNERETIKMIPYSSIIKPIAEKSESVTDCIEFLVPVVSLFG